jgi:hypothetical protein
MVFYAYLNCMEVLANEIVENVERILLTEITAIV